MAELSIFTVCNRGYLPGAVVTLFSLLENLDRAVTADLWLFVEPELADRAGRLVTRCAEHFGRRACVTVRALDATPFAGLRTDWGGSHFAYGRLLAAESVARSRALYVDGDIIFNRDAATLLDEPFDGCTLAAVCDSKVATLAGEEFDCARLGLNADAAYFNSGVMWLDLVCWRSTRVGLRALEFAQTHPDQVKWWDQSALNAVLQGAWKPLPAIWNSGVDRVLGRLEVFPRSRHCRANLHYLGPEKPWLGWSPYGRWFEQVVERLPADVRDALAPFRFRVRDRLRAQRFFLRRAFWNYGSHIKGALLRRKAPR